MRIHKEHYTHHKATQPALFRESRRRFGIPSLLSSLSLLISLPLLSGMSWLRLPAFHSVQTSEPNVLIHIVGASQPPGFQPVVVTVHVGDTLIFRNMAQPSETYTIAAQDHSFISPPIDTGQQWTFIIHTPGTYEYTALGEPPSMVGAIIVTPGSIKLLPTPAPGSVATEVAGIQQQVQRSSSGLSFFSLPILLVVAAVLIGLTTGGVLLLRRRRRRLTRREVKS